MCNFALELEAAPITHVLLYCLICTSARQLILQAKDGVSATKYTYTSHAIQMYSKATFQYSDKYSHISKCLVNSIRTCIICGLSKSVHTFSWITEKILFSRKTLVTPSTFDGKETCLLLKYKYVIFYFSYFNCWRLWLECIEFFFVLVSFKQLTSVAGLVAKWVSQFPRGHLVWINQ